MTVHQHPAAFTGLPNNNAPLKPCHNCRRRRLRCDRSFPTCHKCHLKGEKCLGYGLELKWINSVVASCGRLAAEKKDRHESPKTSPETSHSDEDDGTKALCRPRVDCFALKKTVGLPLSLLDPLLQGLPPRYRNYVNHYANVVCQDLVTFDQRKYENPFRQIICLLGSFDYLREIILATSAVHVVTLRRCQGQSHGQELVDALAARGRACRLLQSALDTMDVSTQPLVLIAVVFFVNFDLIDSGRGSWKIHMAAAGRLISSLKHMDKSLVPAVAMVANVAVADCIAYSALGSVFSETQTAAMSIFDSGDVASLIQRAEPYNYQCCPPEFLQALATTSCMSTSCELSENIGIANALLKKVRGTDVRAWVYGIKYISPVDQGDQEVRVHVASAHRAATALYIVLTLPGAADRPDERADSLVSEILLHLSFVPVHHVLAKGTVWPIFMAAAQTDSPDSRQCCLDRLEAFWSAAPWICPWGYVETAMAMLKEIWSTRDRQRPCEAPGLNWLQQLKGLSDHCLIV